MFHSQISMNQQSTFYFLACLEILGIRKEGLFSPQVRQAGEDLRKVLNERYEAVRTGLHELVAIEVDQLVRINPVCWIKTS